MKNSFYKKMVLKEKDKDLNVDVVTLKEIITGILT
jgi:hypothetical protein